MSIILTRLKGKAAQLSEPEWAEATHALIEALGRPTEPDADVEEAWRAEIERRFARAERGEVDLLPGDEVFERAVSPTPASTWRRSTLRLPTRLR